MTETSTIKPPIASPSKNPLRWYFSARAQTFLTAPLAVLMIYFSAISIFGAILLWLASMKAAWAVAGIIGVVLNLSFPATIFLIPPAIYLAFFFNFPNLWRDEKRSNISKLIITVIALVASVFVAEIAYKGGVLWVGWIADRNPCAALAAGVTGSTPPENCPSR